MSEIGATSKSDAWYVYDLMVARGGIEPPTRGFSVLANLHPGTPSVT